MVFCPSCRHQNEASATKCVRCNHDLRDAKGAVSPVLMPPPPSASEDPMIGQTLGNFRIDEKIARGGFGAVYRGTHTILEQPCAIKVLHFHQKDFETEARFKREAGALAQLHHSHIVRMNDFGMLPTGGFYLVMELLEGPTLFTLFKQGTLFSLTRIKRFAEQMCDVLGYISSKGMIHRDLKPGNIFLIPDEKGIEHVKLIDFGIVSLLFSPDELTQTGAYLGTAKYGSPEQIRGVRQLDVRSDLYALGCILYRMFTGRVPFIGQGGNVLTIIQQQVYEPPPTLASINATHPWASELEAFFQKALAKPPEDRYPTAEAFQEAFALAVAAQEELLVGGVGDMTVLDLAGGAGFDPSETMPAGGLPPALVEALKQAKSTEEKRNILLEMYNEQQPQSTRTLQPPQPLEEVQVHHASSPSMVNIPPVTAPSSDTASKPSASDSTHPDGALAEASARAFRESVDVAKSQSLNEDDMLTDPGRELPLKTPPPIGMPQTSAPSADANTDSTVPAAVNPMLSSQIDVLGGAAEATNNVNGIAQPPQTDFDSLFPPEPTALQRPMRMPSPAEDTDPSGRDSSGGVDVEDSLALTPDERTTVNPSNNPHDPLAALLSQGDARMKLTPAPSIPWVWICLGVGVLLILLWVIF